MPADPPLPAPADPPLPAPPDPPLPAPPDPPSPRPVVLRIPRAAWFSAGPSSASTSAVATLTSSASRNTTVAADRTASSSALTSAGATNPPAPRRNPTRQVSRKHLGTCSHSHHSRPRAPGAGTRKGEVQQSTSGETGTRKGEVPQSKPLGTSSHQNRSRAPGAGTRKGEVPQSTSGEIAAGNTSKAQQAPLKKDMAKQPQSITADIIVPNTLKHVEKPMGKASQTITADSGAISNSKPVGEDQRQGKLAKIFTKYNIMKSHKVEKATTDFNRVVQNIEAEHTSALLDTIRKAMDSPDVALIYHEKMMDHVPPEKYDCEEKPERLSIILDKLKELNILDRCQLFKADRVDPKDLSLVHSPEYIEFVKALSSSLEGEAKASVLESNEDIYFSTGTSEAVLYAAGAAVQACNLVVIGPFAYSFAIVRPPGHHVGMAGPPSGFCFFNNISIAAKHALEHHNLQKNLILDWDVHHADGSQSIFYDTSKVLVVSIHRFGRNVFPRNKDGGLDNIGKDDGTGYNMNICWKKSGVTDADYDAAWDHLLLPLIKEFEPELILLSAGFDAAQNDKLGDCKVTANGFAYLLQKIMDYPIAMILEGGYGTDIGTPVAACVKALLGDQCADLDRTVLPSPETWTMIKATRKKFKPYWKCFEADLPEELNIR